MLYVDFGQVYIKMILVLKENPFEERLKRIKAFRFISKECSFPHEGNFILLVKFNFLKIEAFRDSEEYQEISKMIDSKEAYYTGIIKYGQSDLFEKLFPGVSLIKSLKVINLAVLGLDFINKNIEKAFFSLPDRHITKLAKVGLMEKVEKSDKNYMKNSELFPIVMANITEGNSIYRVDSKESVSRLGGSTFGATTYWSLIQMLCGYSDPEEAVKDAIEGKNELIDLSVGDIYGTGYDRFGLPMDLIASSFGKVKYVDQLSSIDKKDISRSLMTLFCLTSGQITSLIAQREGIKRVIILGNTFECLEFMEMLQMSIFYNSHKQVNAYFSDYACFMNVLGIYAYMKAYDGK